MKPLLSYAAYLPGNVLEQSTLADAVGGPPGSGGRSVAGYDEDAVTMGVAAAGRLTGVPRDAPLFFATASPPFMDKTNATVVRAALGWDDGRLTVDVAGLRGGFGALSVAAAMGGIAVMGDHRSGRSGSADEADGGDAGAAFAFGDGPDPVATVLGTASVSTELMDVWRAPGSDYAQVWEERFSQHALSRAIHRVVSEVGKSSGVVEPPTVTLVSTPQRRFALRSASAIGSKDESGVLAAHRSRVGYCAAADIGVLLARALDSARSGDTILLVNAVGSVDALLLNVLRDGPGDRRWSEQLSDRRSLSYVEFLTWSGRIQREPARRPDKPGVAAPPAARNADWKYALTGGRCTECGKVYLPAHRVCGDCGATDSQVPHSVAGRHGRIAAISTDAVTDTPAPPAVAAMVDFEGGGRLTMEIADSSGAGTGLGDLVEPVFRRTYEAAGVPNYFWKARRVNGAAR
ncbi:zinc ribbon domain-containing protein [Amycolatopsis pithecellobii]|uniref:Hydroxymethylglutaryl-CoA synthase n=1 Tax=Amycolatopsis pithecellobii TaxID=664692 RepID=A0A6N7YLW5_9PSEU|nr:zinc ribbon domain-containing protein [Amycolatopsis pithecellobii]MTD52898.1 hydroxymethylglutaryl-CoA synthase [Amycolatopsis pithecellobii]